VNGTEWEGMESQCCGATIIHCDICSECKEHTEPITQEDIDAEIGLYEWKARHNE